jgi:chromosome segregation ATPase
MNPLLASAMLALLVPAPQSPSSSLADLARKETERRQELDRQGIEARKIEESEAAARARDGTITTSSPVTNNAAPKTSPPKAEARESLRSFQSRIEKLDRDISQGELKLQMLRARADAERRKPVTLRGSGKSASTASADALQRQIQELETKLESTRRERGDVFQAGRRAGYLPGELEDRVR